MTFMQGSKNNRFGLIMKKADADLGDPSYFVLNGDSFLEEEEIYSFPEASGSGARKYYPLGDLKFTGTVDIKTFTNKIEKNTSTKSDQYNRHKEHHTMNRSKYY